MREIPSYFGIEPNFSRIRKNSVAMTVNGNVKTYVNRKYFTKCPYLFNDICMQKPEKKIPNGYVLNKFNEGKF